MWWSSFEKANSFDASFFHIILWLRFLAAKKGSKSSVPGSSCKDILASGDAQGDGEYWIDPTASGDPFTVFCDMVTDGGKSNYTSNPLTHIYFFLSALRSGWYPASPKIWMVLGAISLSTNRLNWLTRPFCKLNVTWTWRGRNTCCRAEYSCLPLFHGRQKERL